MIRIITLGVLLGILALHGFKFLPAAWWLLLCTPFLVLLRLRFNRILLFINALAMGFVLAFAHAWWQLRDPLPASAYGQDVTVRGFIASLPECTTHKQSFEFDVTAVLQPGALFKLQRLRLTWYEPSDTQVQVGEEWEFTVRLKPARNFANPGMFNYTGWLFQKGIRYTGYVRTSEKNHLIEHSPWSYPIQQVRASLKQQLKVQLADYPFEPILRALLIGDRSDISQNDWTILKKTGTVHLMAISGLHVGLIAGFVFIFARFAWSRFPMLCSLLAAPRAAAIFAILGALSYSALAGFSLPTQRALIMLSVVMVSYFAYRQINVLDVLSVALLLVLVLDPHATLSASFWLSFSAVALIFFVLQANRRHRSVLRDWFSLQIVIGLGLIPISILFFQQAPLVSPIANMIAIPLVSFIVIPLAMLGVLILCIHTNAALAVFSLLDLIFSWLWQILEAMAHLPFASMVFSSPNMLGLSLAILGVVLLILPRVYGFRYLAFVLFIPLLFPCYDKPRVGEAYLTILDVGQGLSAIIRTRTHTLVFDTGPRLGRQFDTGRAVVVPYLRTQGITHIDTLLISHGDNDHIGGAASILSLLPVNEVVSSVPALLKPYAAKQCNSTMQWVWDDVTIKVIYPSADDYTAGLSENNLSCVIKVQTRSQTFLLTGDIEVPAEQRLVTRYAAELRSDILVVPHHGSRTSSSSVFISTIQPRIAIFPVGWRNRYHFPNPVVMQRYQDAGIRFYSTASSGAITIDSASRNVHQFRPDVTQFWEE